MKLTRNFNLEEFLISDSHPELIEKAHIPARIKWNLQKLSRILLQNVRDYIAAPLHITSGFRTDELNRALKGAPASQHLFGEAADFTIRGGDGAVDQEKMEKALQFIKTNLYFAVGQCIDYRNADNSLRHIHISLPDNRHFSEFFTKIVK